MSGGHQIVLVDGLSETEEVLKAVFEPKGTRIARIRHLNTAKFFEPDSRPNVVVLHESDAQPAHPELECFESIPRVVIRSVLQTEDSESSDSETFYLQKPFQYPELVRAVERLLEQGC